MAGSVRDDFAARAGFSERHRCGTRSGTLACDGAEDLAPIGSAPAPTVCGCCYWMSRGRTDVGNRTLTITGPVFRNEASDEDRLQRHRRDADR